MKWLVIRLGLFGIMVLWVWIFAIHFPRLEWSALFCSGLFVVMGILIVLVEFWSPWIRAIVAVGLLIVSFAFEYFAVSTIPDYYYSDDMIACYDQGTGKIYRQDVYRRGIVTIYENPLVRSRIVCLEKDFAVTGYVGNTYFLARFAITSWQDKSIADKAVLIDELRRVYPFSSSCYPNGYDCPGDPMRFGNAEKKFMHAGGETAINMYQRVKGCAAAIATYYPPEVGVVCLSGIPRDYLHLSARAWLGKQTWFAPETLKLCDFSADGLAWQSLMLRKGGAWDE